MGDDKHQDDQPQPVDENQPISDLEVTDAEDADSVVGGARMRKGQLTQRKAAGEQRLDYRISRTDNPQARLLTRSFPWVWDGGAFRGA
jgi:hypothetical protein